MGLGVWDSREEGLVLALNLAFRGKGSGGQVWGPGRKRKQATFKSSLTRGSPPPSIKKHSVGSFHPSARPSSETQKQTVLLSLPNWGSLFPGTDELAGPWAPQCPSRETSISRVELGPGQPHQQLWSKRCRGQRVISGPPPGQRDPERP